VKKPQDLRKILSQNIRNARVSLHISQAKLAECAGVSVPHILDIEYCKTWVSDKTLQNIAKALNVEAFELLLPEKNEKKSNISQNNAILQQAASLIRSKKSQLRRKTGEVMDDLIMEIVKLG
jgi:transcriptional regulator with XRE-family HTH domain